MATDNGATRAGETPGVWRDEQRLPLDELTQAVAVNATDGQADDLSGNDAGIEQALDELPRNPKHGTGGGDPDPDSAEGRRLRPDFTGPTGPH